MKTSKRSIISLAMFWAISLSGIAQSADAQDSTICQKRADSKTYAARFEKFVNHVAACDTLTSAQRDEVANTYTQFLEEYKQVKDSLSDEDVRICSKSKVKYQKAKARIFVNNTTDSVADTAEGVGNSVSKFFKKTKKKMQGAIEGFKEN